MEKREIIGKFVVHWNILLRILDLICTVACKIWIKRSLPLTVLFSRIVFSPIFSEVFFHFDFSLNWLRNIFDIFFPRLFLKNSQCCDFPEKCLSARVTPPRARRPRRATRDPPRVPTDHHQLATRATTDRQCRGPAVGLQDRDQWPQALQADHKWFRFLRDKVPRTKTRTPFFSFHFLPRTSGEPGYIEILQKNKFEKAKFQEAGSRFVNNWTRYFLLLQF